MSFSEDSGCDGTNTRSSPKRIAEVVSKFGELKKKLVSEICFQGMLKVPDILSLDISLTMHILKQIDTRTRSIKINGDTLLEFTAEVVHRYLDIPMGPKELFGLDDRSPSEKMDFIRFGIGSSSFDIDEKNSLKAAEEIVTAWYPNGMTENQVEQFKVSFVCFCMGHFLIAKYSSNHGIKDYWGSLMKPSEISSYNFCQAVVDEIIEAAKHVQKETKANRAVKNISGCHLFLQAMFLDGMNLGILDVPRSVVPRINVFTYPVLRKMISCLNQNTNQAKGEQTPNSGIHKTSKVNPGRRTLPPIPRGESSTTPVTKTITNIRKHPINEYLAAYTRGQDERKLNDKQIDDLRLHNARMKLFILNFKEKSLGELYPSNLPSQNGKEVFISNVDDLLNKVLDQVLVLSKSLHAHTETRLETSMPSPSLYTSSKKSSDDATAGYGSSSSCIPFKRQKTLCLPTGKNLLNDLSQVADKATASDPATIINKTGNKLLGSSGSEFDTPHKYTAVTYAAQIPNQTAASSDINEANASSSKTTAVPIIEEAYKTPVNLMKISSDSPSENGLDRNEYKDAIDLNETPVNDDIIYSPMIKIRVIPGRMARNPGFYAVTRKPVDKEVADTFLHWLSVTKSDSLDSLWVNHPSPKRLKIYGNDIKSVFTRGHNFTKQLLDLAIRRFAQVDRNMYGEGEKLRWIHPFESDFADKIMNNECVLDSRSVRTQLIGNSGDYNISNCRMIAVPYLSDLTWCSYFWDMKQHVVHVLDPTFESSRACDFHELHSPIVDKLQGEIQSCLAAAYEGWKIDWSCWTKNYVKPFLPGKGSNESGMMTLLALREFNGIKFEVPQTEGSLRWFASKLLYDMLSIEGNSAALPDVYIQSID